MTDRLARLVYPGFWFGKTETSDALRLVKMGVGGFCIYGGTAKEVFEFTRLLRSSSPAPLVFCADYENGAGQWVKEATELPSGMAVGACGLEELAAKKAEITAVESAALGVDWVLSPVVDLASRPDNPIVNTRAFGDDPEPVSRLAGAYMSGLGSRGVLSCLKHFPGHGETSLDSHLALPVLERTRSQLDSAELKPYRSLLQTADAVMIGHLKLEDIDPDMPASLSKKIITGLLRNELGFKRLVVTDALSMKAVSDDDRAGVAALTAGADILLVPENPFRLCESLEKAYGEGLLTDNVVCAALERQSSMIGKLQASRPKSRPSLDVVGCAAHRGFVEESACKCIAWAVRPPASSLLSSASSEGLRLPDGSKDGLLSAGDSVRYFEPGVENPRDWNGRAFVSELGSLGIKAVPVSDPKTGKLIVASFSRPRAYSGSINLSSRDRADILRLMSPREQVFMISFGSPFVFKGFREKIKAGLCAFGALEVFQKTCARALAGKAEIKGEMPVIF